MESIDRRNPLNKVDMSIAQNGDHDLPFHRLDDPHGLNHVDDQFDHRRVNRSARTDVLCGLLDVAQTPIPLLIRTISNGPTSFRTICALFVDHAQQVKRMLCGD